MLSSFRPPHCFPAFLTTNPLPLRHTIHHLHCRLRPAIPSPSRRLPSRLLTCTMAHPLPPPPPAPASIAGNNPVFAQAMLRIHDPVACDRFYTSIGMKLLTRMDFDNFSLFFYAYTNETPPSLDLPQIDRAKWLWTRPEPTVELTWNWPKDTYEESLKAVNDPDTNQELYLTGKGHQKGFHSLEIAVENLAPILRLVKEQKLPYQLRTHHTLPQPVLETQDPTGYPVVFRGPFGDVNESLEDADPVLAAVALHVKDPHQACEFFERVGMKLLAKIESELLPMSTYHLAYTDKTAPVTIAEQRHWLAGLRECTIQLIHIWGSEKEEGAVYCNGNQKNERGYGHVGIIVDDIYDVVKQLRNDYRVVLEPLVFKQVAELAFVAEPSTDYYLEVIKREGKARQSPYEQPCRHQ